MKMKVFTMVSVAIFVLGLVGFTMSRQKPAALTSQEASRFIQEALPPRAFTATRVESVTDAKGSDKVRHIRICEVKEDGSWSEVWQNVGREGAKFLTGNPNTGEHTLGNGKDSMTLPTKAGASSDLALYRNREYLSRRAGPQGREKIAGLEAFVIRSDITDQPGLWIETAHAPETGTFNLRLTHHMPDGSEVRIETIRIVFK